MINKNQFNIKNNKKRLIKSGKNWIVASTLTLALIGLGGMVNVSANQINSNSASTTKIHAMTSNPYHIYNEASSLHKHILNNSQIQNSNYNRLRNNSNLNNTPPKNNVQNNNIGDVVQKSNVNKNNNINQKTSVKNNILKNKSSNLININIVNQNSSVRNISNNTLKSNMNQHPKIFHNVSLSPNVVEISGKDGHIQDESGNHYQLNLGTAQEGEQYKIDTYKLFDSTPNSNDGKSNIEKSGYYFINPEMYARVNNNGTASIIPESININTEKEHKTITSSNFYLESRKAGKIIARYMNNGSMIGQQVIASDGYIGDTLSDKDYSLQLPPEASKLLTPKHNVPFKPYINYTSFNVEVPQHISKYNIPIYVQQVNSNGNPVEKPELKIVHNYSHPIDNSDYIYVPMNFFIPQDKRDSIYPISQDETLEVFGHFNNSDKFTFNPNGWKGNNNIPDNQVNTQGHWNNAFNYNDKVYKYNGCPLIRFIQSSGSNNASLIPVNQLNIRWARYMRLKDGSIYAIPGLTGKYHINQISFPEGQGQNSLFVKPGTTAKILLNPKSVSNVGPDSFTEWPNDSPYVFAHFNSNNNITYSLNKGASYANGVQVHYFINQIPTTFHFIDEYGKNIGSDISNIYRQMNQSAFIFKHDGDKELYYSPYYSMVNNPLPLLKLPEGYSFNENAQGGKIVYGGKDVYIQVKGDASRFVINFNGTPETISGNTGDNTPFGPIQPGNRIPNHPTLSATEVVPLQIQKVNDIGQIIDTKTDYKAVTTNFKTPIKFSLPNDLSNYANQNWDGYKLDSNKSISNIIPNTNDVSPIVWKYQAIPNSVDYHNDKNRITAIYYSQNGKMLGIKWLENFPFKLVPGQNKIYTASDLSNYFLTNEVLGSSSDSMAFRGNYPNWGDNYNTNQFKPFSGYIDGQYNIINGVPQLNVVNATGTLNDLTYILPSTQNSKGTINIQFKDKTTNQPVSSKFTFTRSIPDSVAQNHGFFNLNPNGNFIQENLPNGYNYDAAYEDGEKLQNNLIEYNANAPQNITVYVSPKEYSANTYVNVVTRYRNIKNQWVNINTTKLPLNLTGTDGQIFNFAHNTSIVNNESLDQLENGYNYDNHSEDMNFTMDTNGGSWSINHIPTEYYDLNTGLVTVNYINSENNQPISTYTTENKGGTKFNLGETYYEDTKNSKSLIPDGYQLDYRYKNKALLNKLENMTITYNNNPQIVNIYVTPIRPNNNKIISMVSDKFVFVHGENKNNPVVKEISLKGQKGTSINVNNFIPKQYNENDGTQFIFNGSTHYIYLGINGSTGYNGNGNPEERIVRPNGNIVIPTEQDTIDIIKFMHGKQLIKIEQKQGAINTKFNVKSDIPSQYNEYSNTIFTHDGKNHIVQLGVKRPNKNDNTVKPQQISDVSDLIIFKHGQQTIKTERLQGQKGNKFNVKNDVPSQYNEYSNTVFTYDGKNHIVQLGVKRPNKNSDISDSMCFDKFIFIDGKNKFNHRVKVVTLGGQNNSSINVTNLIPNSYKYYNHTNTLFTFDNNVHYIYLTNRNSGNNNNNKHHSNNQQTHPNKNIIIHMTPVNIINKNSGKIIESLEISGKKSNSINNAEVREIISKQKGYKVKSINISDGIINIILDNNNHTKLPNHHKNNIPKKPMKPSNNEHKKNNSSNIKPNIPLNPSDNNKHDNIAPNNHKRNNKGGNITPNKPSNNNHNNNNPVNPNNPNIPNIPKHHNQNKNQVPTVIPKLIIPKHHIHKIHKKGNKNKNYSDNSHLIIHKQHHHIKHVNNKIPTIYQQRSLNKVKPGHSVFYHHNKITRVKHQSLYWFYIIHTCLAHTNINSVGYQKNYDYTMHPGHTLFYHINRIFIIHRRNHKNLVRFEFSTTFNNKNVRNYFVTGNPYFTRNSYIQSHNLIHAKKFGVFHKYYKIHVVHDCKLYTNKKYSNKSFIRNVKVGENFKVRKLIKIGYDYQTRFLLKDGKYITANKNYVKLV